MEMVIRHHYLVWLIITGMCYSFSKSVKPCFYLLLFKAFFWYLSNDILKTFSHDVALAQIKV